MKAPKMTREEYLAAAKAASDALLAELMAETEETIESEQANAKSGQTFEYVPDGGGDVRTTRSGRWIMDLK